MSCDFRFCTPEAEFGVPEVRSLGVLAGIGGTSRLTRLAGPAWGKWMAMACRRIPAGQARQARAITFDPPLMTTAASRNPRPIACSRIALGPDLTESGEDNA